MGTKLGTLAVAAIALLVGLATKPVAAQDFVARSGWQLESFGTDVAVLRTILMAPRSGASGQLLLSCDGPQRRIRLVLPDKAALPPGPTGGVALVKAAGRPAASSWLVARFSIDRDGVLSIVETADAGGRAALSLARLLRSRPARLEIILQNTSSPITIRRALIYATALAFAPADGPAFDGFIAVCTRKSG